MFAFELPWQRGSDGLAAMAHGQSDPPPLEKYYPKIHPVLSQAIMRCLRADPHDRFPDMEGFLNAIRGVPHEDVE